MSGKPSKASAKSIQIHTLKILNKTPNPLLGLDMKIHGSVLWIGEESHGSPVEPETT